MKNKFDIPMYVYMKTDAYNFPYPVRKILFHTTRVFNDNLFLHLLYLNITEIIYTNHKNINFKIFFPN